MSPVESTAIEWTDSTWNPVTGCDKVSPGCKFCYAETIALKNVGGSFPDGFAVRLRPERLGQPTRWRTPRRIFVNSMSDLFHPLVPFAYIDQVFATIERCPQHTFQILTKRPERMAEWSRSYGPWPLNAWAGTSIESSLYADRVQPLSEVPAQVRFISAEPLLGELVLDLRPIHWLIVGGESGDHWRQLDERSRQRRFLIDGPPYEPRPQALEWVRWLRDQSIASGTAFFFKQWGGPRPKSGGALLDGRKWQEYPPAREPQPTTSLF